MLDALVEFWGLITGSVAGLIIFILGMGFIAFLFIKGSLFKKQLPTIPPGPKKAEVGAEEVEKPQKVSVLGTGNLKCMCFRPGNILDFTTIPKPIGELHIADTSLPFSGGVYTVMELENGEIVDYDQRDTPIVQNEMPEHAWFAVHWDIVKDVFSVPLSWWQSTSTWFAVACLIGYILLALVYFGG